MLGCTQVTKDDAAGEAGDGGTCEGKRNAS